MKTARWHLCNGPLGFFGPLVSYGEWGGRPRPRWTPWSGSVYALKIWADEGVGRGPGDRPTPSVRHGTSETGHQPAFVSVVLAGWV
jgi:hypothetical protein